MTKHLTVRLPDELAAEAEAVARAEGMSLNETIREALVDAVERRRMATSAPPGCGCGCVRPVWRQGIAHLMEDDDPYARQRSLSRWHPLRSLNAAVVRVMGPTF